MSCLLCDGKGWFRPRGFSFLPVDARPMLVNQQIVCKCFVCCGFASYAERLANGDCDD